MILTKLGTGVVRIKRTFVRYHTQRLLTEAVSQHEARISALKVYVRTTESSPACTRAIEQMKHHEREISRLLGQLSSLRYP